MNCILAGFFILFFGSILFLAGYGAGRSAGYNEALSDELNKEYGIFK